MDHFFYIVNEIIENPDGNRASVPLIYDNENEAMSKFFAICSIAVISEIPFHGAYVMRSDGTILDTPRMYDRRPEPEPSSDSEKDNQEEK